MAAPTVTVEMNFGGPLTLRQKLVDSGATALWPFDEISGDVHDVIGDVAQDEIDNTSRGDDGLLPEYGCAITFRGETYISYAHESRFNGPTAWAFAVMLRLRDTNTLAAEQIVMTKNYGVAGEVKLRFVPGPPAALSVSATIGGVLRTLSYTVPSLSDWQNEPRLVLVRYTGSAFDLITVDADGTWATRATLAVSGTFATGTSDLVFGATAVAGSLFFDGRLQLATWWTNDYPADDEIDDFALSLPWTDISRDVLANVGIALQTGIRGSGPMDKLGDIGTLQFVPNNSRRNTARLQGYYVPGHTNAPTGFCLGAPVRLTLTDPADPTTPHRKFVGRLVDIDPPADARTVQQRTACVAADYFYELEQATLPALPMIEGAVFNDVLAALITALPTKPHQSLGAASFDEAQTYDYGLDTRAEDDEATPPSVLDEVRHLVQTEWGAVYMRGGALTAETRQTRQAKTTPDWTLNGTMHGLRAGIRSRDVLTRVNVTGHPREEEAVPATLYTFTEPTLFNYGTSRSFTCVYQDPDPPHGAVAAAENTIALGYTANSRPDGTGDDLTAFISTRNVVKGANAASFELLYSGTYITSAIWVTSITISGTPVRLTQPFTASAIASDTLRSRVGDNTLDIDQPYQNDPTRAFNLAAFILAGWGRTDVTTRSLRLKASAASSDAIVSAVCGIEPGDLIRLTEEGTAQTAVDFFVNGYDLRISHTPEEGLIAECELILAPREITVLVPDTLGFDMPEDVYPAF